MPSLRAVAIWLGALFSLCAVAGRAAEAPESSASREIFATHGPGVVKVEIQEAGSSAKSSIGSGFAVAPSGLFVTNYHVIAALVDRPERYQVRIREQGGAEHEAKLVAFDVVQDLALLQSLFESPHVFELHDGPALRKGERLFSLGNPLDLGMSVVEGTYNGLLEHSRYARIHWSGSLNPGMSGGPAVLRDGRVAGVNVATAGDQVSFLVPVQQVAELLGRTRAAGFEPPADPREELRAQLLAQQESYLAEILGREWRSVRMGPYSAPTELTPYFNCWGDAPEDEEAYYSERTHACFTEDHVFISDDHSFAIVELHHIQISSEELSGRRFYALYSQLYEEEYSRRWGRKEDVTPFRCETEFVEHAGLTFKTSFCARRYRRLAGLHDVVFKAAALGKPSDGFATALLMSGVALEPARKLSRRVLESITWAE